MNWDSFSLDELGSVSRGRSKHRPRNDASLFGGNYPFIQTADVKSANFYITEYTETYNEKGLAQSKLWHPGTLCITIAANIADTAILGIDACFPDSIMGFIPYEGVADVRFVKYLFDMLQKDMKQISQGTAQDNLSWEKLSTIKFPVPHIDVQRKIADYLSSYDNLIANNQKQIKLLEEAVHRMYKKLFVQQRTVLHNKTYAYNKIKLGEIALFVRGKIITNADVIEGKVPVVAGGLEPAYYHNKANTHAPVVTVSGSGANAGFTNIYLKDVWASDCSFVDAESTNYPYYVFCFLKSNRRVLDNLQRGSAQPHVYAKDINNIDITFPDRKLIDTFERTVSPMFEKIKTALAEIKYLKEARDRLLPKLMNGEIEV